MPEAKSWEVLADAGPGGVILGVDFPAAGRAEAGFADLLEKIGSHWSQYGFLQTVAPAGRLDRSALGPDYTERWAGAIRADGRQVAAVFGYCAGSVYAAAIAEEVRKWQQQAPMVILFDPHHVDAWAMTDEMYKMIGFFGGLLTADQVEDAKHRTVELARSESGDIVDLASALIGLYQEIGSAAFDKVGLAEARRAEVINLFESYMAWLCATAQIDPSDTWKRSPAILSAEYVAVTGQHPAVTSASKLLSRKIPVNVSHSDLLRSESTAQIVLDQMRNV